MFSSNWVGVSSIAAFRNPASCWYPMAICCGPEARPGSIRYETPSCFDCPAKHSTTASTASVWYCCTLN